MKQLKQFMKFIILLFSFQYLYSASLSGVVWFDANLNGLKEKDEGGIAQIRIHLYKDDVDTGIMQKTQVGGIFKFDNLEPNHKYKIKVDKPKNYPYFTIYNVDNNSKDDRDSDINPYTGFSDSVLLEEEDEEYTTLFAGLVCMACKKIDIEKHTNGEDADMGTGPVILEGDKVVWEYNVSNMGNVELTEIVVEDDKEGVIDCPSAMLPPGESMLCIKEGIAKKGVYENVATVTAKTPDNDEVNDKDPSHYLGKAKSVCLGNFYWYDANLNGIQDKDEAGVVGIRVELYNAKKHFLKAVKTDKKGEYYFCNLEPGEYFVKFDLPETYLFTPKDKGSDIKDSDADRDGWSPKIVLEGGKKDFSIDVGIYCSCDDYKVHPNEYKSLDFASSFESGLVLLVVLFLISITFRKNVNKNS